MTKKTALLTAIAKLSTDTDNYDVVEVLNSMLEQLDKRTERTPEQKAAANAKRKEATAAARAEMVATVAPVLRKYMTEDMTAKEIFAAAEAELPDYFSAIKVQNVLLREMASEVVKTEHKGKANTYRLA